MKTKLIYLSFLITAVLYPTFTFASWWNPLTWKKPSVVRIATSTQSTPTAEKYTPPPAEELLKRIVELEDKLDKARSQKEVVTVKDEVVTNPKVDTDSGDLSGKQIVAKVKPSIVFVETATSSGSASIIDKQGHILVDARTVWTTDVNGVVIGVADKISVVLSNGKRTNAHVVGMNEARNIAILQLVSKNSSSSLKLNYDSGLSVGDKVYVFSFSPYDNSSYISGTVSKKNSSVIEVVTEAKPSDIGGVIVNASGDIIGIPNKSTCKVLEEMKTCLKYTITTNSIKGFIPKLIEGMILYKDKRNSTEIESSIRGQFERARESVKISGKVNIAISNLKEKDNFDYFDEKLIKDKDGKIAKLYLLKLKLFSENIYDAVDTLRSTVNKLQVFLVNNNNSFGTLGDYQKKIIKNINSENELKLKEYQKKIGAWSLKAKEYNSLVAKATEVEHEYLMEQAVFVESEVDYLIAEQKRIIETFSGETVDIF